MKPRKTVIIIILMILLFGCNEKNKYSESVQNGYKYFEELIPLLNDKKEVYAHYDKIWLPENFYEYIKSNEIQETKLDITRVVEDFYGWDYGYRMEKGTIVINVDENKVIKISMIPKFDEENAYTDLRGILDPFIEIMNQEYNMLLGDKYQRGMTIDQLEEYMVDYYTSEVINSLVEEISKKKDEKYDSVYLSYPNILGIPSWVYDEETGIYELFTPDAIQKGDIYTNYIIVKVYEFSDNRIDVVIIGEYIYDAINYHEYFEERVKLVKLDSIWMLADLLESNKKAVGIMS